jgi:hypothetical protein
MSRTRHLRKYLHNMCAPYVRARGLALVANRGLNIEVFAGVIVRYPPSSEVGKRVAATYLSRDLTSPLVRRIMGWLRRFG